MPLQNFRRPAAAICVAVIGGVLATPAAAQSVLAYPAKGQSAEQTRKDEIECEMWATDRTGFNPRSGPPQSYGYTQDSGSYSSGGRGFGSGDAGQGGVVGDGARGAALGAMGGAIAGNAGKGAAIGALSGAIFGGMKRNQRKQQEADWQRQQQAQQQQVAQQQQQAYYQAKQNFNGAVGLCMESRDYKVQY